MISGNKNLSELREELPVLIQRARDGSVDALQFLKSKYTPLIESQVGKFFADYMSNQDREDMYEEALSAFCDAVCSYDHEKGNVEFGLYAKICISNRLVTFLRAYNSRKISGVSSLDEMQGYVGGENTDPLELVVQKENIQLLVGIIEKNLSPYEARVWWMYTSGMSAKDIATKLATGDVRSVTNAIYRIRRKLRALLSN